MADEIFKRVEKKYILTEEKYIKLIDSIKEYIKPNKYYYNTICNIYYDSDDYYIARSTIEKPAYKEKIRLRSYNVPNLNSEVYFELKRKYKDIVGKRRVKLKLDDVEKLIDFDIWVNHNNQLIKELKYCFYKYELKPKIYIAYERYAYEGINDNNLRITFDSNLRSRDYNLSLQSGDYGRPYFNQDKYLMEIKTLDTIPLWLVNILSKFKIYSEPFSKYGEIYKQKLRLDRGENLYVR